MHVVLASALFALSAMTTWVMMRWVRVMDYPNDRSAHLEPTPKSGGIAIVVTFLIGIGIVTGLSGIGAVKERYFAGFVLSTITVAVVSFYDDVRNKPFAVKLATQLLAVAVVLVSGIVIDEISLPFIGPVTLGPIGVPFSFLWILGLTNAFNFMDGVDGLVAGVATLASAFFLVITLSRDSTFVWVNCYTLGAGCLGFLVFNWPPARVFMGDVGSASLGFVFATLAIIAARYDASHTSFMVMPLLLFTFIFDTAFTFSRRWLSGEPVTQPHRSHLYQLVNRLGFSHRIVSLGHYGACAAQGCLAAWMVEIPGSARVIVFLPVLLAHAAYAVVVIRASRKANLIV